MRGKTNEKILAIIIVVLALLSIVACNDGTSTTTSPPKELEYKEVFEGDKIETDFVLITIDDVSKTNTIRSINSKTVLNAKDGEEYVYLKGTIKNKSNSTYDLGSLGSY